MGRKRKKDKDVESYEHLGSLLKIHSIKCCSQCPIKIYNDKDATITFGIGNIVTDTILILPSYDISTKIGYNSLLEIVINIYREITGKNLLEECYVTRYIKCFNNTNYDLDAVAIDHCKSNLYYEIGRIKPKKVISFNKIHKEHLFPDGSLVHNVISPGVMYYNDQKLKDLFIKQFTEALNK